MKTKNIFFILLILTFIFLRIYQLPQVVNFSMDQGTTLLRIYQNWQTKKISLIGPESSIKTQSGRAFFHGPWIDYFLLPVMLISNWNPLAGSYFFIFLNLVSLLFLYPEIKKKKGETVALIYGFLFTFSFLLIRFSQFLWNPNFLPFVSSLMLYLLIKIDYKPKPCYFFLIGLVLGFGLGCHYQFIFIVLGVLGWILILKNYNLKLKLACLIGLLVSLSPLIIFELRHNFYNFKTLMLIINTGSQKSLMLPLPAHYFLSLLPFVFLLESIVLAKIIKKKFIWGLIIISLFAAQTLFKIIPKQESGYTMPVGWNYIAIEKVVKIMLEQNVSDFNVASLLSGDTRNYPVRFLLTVNKKPPMKTEEYPNSKYLFVISQHNENKTINNSVWEISSFCPCRIKNVWEIQNKIKLYLLQKKESG